MESEKERFGERIKDLFFANYTKKQKIVSFIIGVGFSLVVVILVALNLLLPEKVSLNPLSFIDDPIVDRFFIKRFKSSDNLRTLATNESLNLVLVKIDDESLAKMNLKWPIPRSVYASLLDKINQGKAKVVGFDIIFADPSDPKEDIAFAEALEKVKNVVLAEYFYVSSEGLNPEDVGSVDEEKNRIQVFRPYKPFTEAVGLDHLGFVSATIGKVVRRISFAVDVMGSAHYSLPVVMCANFMGIKREDMKNYPLQGYFQMGDMKIPTSQNLARINYFFPPSELTYKYKSNLDLRTLINEVSLKDVLEEKDPEILRGLFENKIVLIGPTAEGAGDIKLTPFGQIPGVYVHANIILSILNRKFLKDTPPIVNIFVLLFMGILMGLVIPRLSPPAGAVVQTGGTSWRNFPLSLLNRKFLKDTPPIVNIFVLLFMGILMGLVIPRLSPPAGAVFTFLVVFLYYQFTYYAFLKKETIYFISSPILVASLSFAAINAYHHLVEIKTKESFSKMFRQFAPLPVDLIEKYIEEYGGSAATGGEFAHLTILFADIRGYTQMSENMSSDQVMGVLNKYHQAMGEVFEKTGGVVFTYIGDAQLVVYGLQGESKINHAAAAIKAGLMMQDKMREIKEDLAKDGVTSFEVGIGICTGPLSVGVVGSEQLKQYTVIGDTVNVASRIQGMSKELNAPVLAHERTYIMAKECVEAERLRPVKLKGKKELVYVYRCKKVNCIKPYNGTVEDLDREVEEHHRKLEEERLRLKREREKVRRESPTGEIPKGIRRRGRRFKRKEEDLLEPLEEKAKGKTADEGSLEPLEEKAKGKEVE